ncbi:hypothetical protein IQ279_12195 [Streptomyces verrucosisporus]|uniref:hypothetical protein n=1 Tax=Streptomyces verrucosisporus TaxID=1695161 RepID=UPI0019D31B37|nr:hypothetical protein [Streptomyces verrucosisporus]MBN3930385.1 hypothetical protein [Streptomyces verrucosisporus]
MRNAVKCALVSGLLATGTLAPLCGAALAVPAPRAPSALVLAAAPERTGEADGADAPACTPEGSGSAGSPGRPGGRSAPEILCVWPDGAKGDGAEVFAI